MIRRFCGKCGKTVRDKPVLGTLHICESPERAAQEAYARLLAEQQFRAPPPSLISYRTFNHWPVYEPETDQLVEKVEVRDGRMRVKAGGQWYVLPATSAPNREAESGSHPQIDPR